MNTIMNTSRKRDTTIIVGEGKRARISAEDHAVFCAIAVKRQVAVGIIVGEALATHLTQNPDLQAIADKALANAA